MAGSENWLPPSAALAFSFLCTASLGAVGTTFVFFSEGGRGVVIKSARMVSRVSFPLVFFGVRSSSSAARGPEEQGLAAFSSSSGVLSSEGEGHCLLSGGLLRSRMGRGFA